MSDRPILEIFSAIPLNFHQTNDEAYDALALHLSALKKGVNSLVTRHSHSPSAGLPPIRHLSQRNDYRLFPYPTTFTSLLGPSKGEQVEFSYTEGIANNSLIFIGQMKNMSQLWIEFTRQSGEDMHRWCSERGLVPKLLGFERLVGGWSMVIIERSDESWVHLADRNTSRGTAVQATITQLHEEECINHGDIQSTNILE